MEVLSLDLLFGEDLYPVEGAELRDVVEHLEAVVLLVLHGVEAQVQLRQQHDVLYVHQLPHLIDIVEGEVEEPEALNML